MSRIPANIRPSEPHWLRTRLRFNRLKHKVRGHPTCAASAISVDDVRQFFIAYCACFLAVTAFIA